jgi:hypothetical protein
MAHNMTGLGGYNTPGRESWRDSRIRKDEFVRDSVEGYCLKDKKKVEMQDPKPITMKNGKPATVGTCPVCGTKIYKIGKSNPAS